jgi:putative peptide zinc metalloprotease protein
MSFPPEAHVEILLTVRRPEEDEMIVGRVDTGVFLVIPTEASLLLDELAAGRTVGEAQAAFLDRYGELPDMEEFLSLLAAKGLVEARAPGGAGIAEDVALAGAATAAAAAPAAQRFHFARLSERLARRLFSRASITLALALIAAALGAIVVDRGLLPGWHALYFREHLTAMTLLISGFYYASLLVHEIAHLIAARSVGVPSRLRIGHRLWVLVAETDMSGLWAVPRSQRYLPLLAGPLVDGASASLLVLALFGAHRAWWPLATPATALLRAFLLIYLLNLLWQGCLFVRTDLYYVLSNYFGCKNLLGDTEAWLASRCRRLLPFLAAREAPAIPERELRVVKAYTVIWFLGRVVALGALVFVYLPLALHYFSRLFEALTGGFRGGHDAFFDALVPAVLILGPLVAGSWLWLRSLKWLGLGRSAKTSESSA